MSYKSYSAAAQRSSQPVETLIVENLYANIRVGQQSPQRQAIAFAEKYNVESREIQR